MRPVIIALLFSTLLCSTQMRAQSKKTEQLLTAGDKAAVMNQTLLLNNYYITTTINSKSFFPDPLMAGSNTIVECTGTPSPGSAANTLKLNFVTDAPIYPKAEYNAGSKTIYATQPLSQLPVILAQLEKTLDKPNDKKLKAFFLEDAAGASFFSLTMYTEKPNNAVPSQPENHRPLPPPAQPVKQ